MKISLGTLVMGLIILSSGILSFWVIEMSVEIETKSIHCVDGNENLIINLPEELSCVEEIRGLWGSEIIYVTLQLLSLISMVIGGMLVMLGLLGGFVR